jgi:hypothetical protein
VQKHDWENVVLVACAQAVLRVHFLEALVNVHRYVHHLFALGELPRLKVCLHEVETDRDFEEAPRFAVERGGDFHGTLPCVYGHVQRIRHRRVLHTLLAVRVASPGVARSFIIIP